MIVEDNQIECLRLSKILEIKGFIPIINNDGFSALESCHKYQFDAVLVDIQMPGMDGFTFVQNLRKVPGKEKVPFIMMTASKHENRHIMEAVELGAKDFIVKPIDPEILLSKLSNLLKTSEESWSERIINPADFQVVADLSVSTKIYSISEMGMTILSDTGLSINTVIHLNWKLFLENEIGTVPLKVVDCTSKDKSFLIEVTFLAIPEPSLKKIRQLISKISINRATLEKIS